MRILVVSQYLWPENFRINDLVIDFVKRGFKVTVLTGYPNYPAGKIFSSFEANKQQFSCLEGAEVVRCPLIPRGRGKAKLILNYLSFAISASTLGVWKLRNKPFDLIFVYQVSPATIAIPAIILKKSRGIPLVFWILDLWPETLIALGVMKRQVLINVLKKIIRKIYSNCDLILVQSHGFLEKIIQQGVSPTKVVYFPSWAEDLFTGVRPSPAKEISPDPTCFKIIFAGNIGDAQDFPNLLDAAEILKNQEIKVQWFILGSGRRTTWVNEEIKKRKLSDNFLMLGSFPVERMPSFYAHADALLVSLRDEPIFSMTIPAKVQSYLAFGMPLLGVLAGEGANLINKTRSGLTAHPGKPRDLAETIKKFISLSPEERAEMGRNAIRVSREQFNREKLFDELEDQFEKLCPSRNY